MASISITTAPRLQLSPEVRAQMALQTQQDGAVATQALGAAAQVAGLVGGAAQEALGQLGHGGLPLLSPASVGADPSANARSLRAKLYLARSGKIGSVQTRVSFLARLILGKKKDAEYKDREHSSGFLVSGGRGFSDTMNVGIPAERAVALADGWKNLDLSEKKKDLESLLRNQINARDFASHSAEKTTLLQRALSRLLSSSSKATKLTIITLLLGNNPKEALQSKFSSLTKAEKTKIFNQRKKTHRESRNKKPRVSKKRKNRRA